LPRYARGATPAIVTRPPPTFTFVPAFPAAMPATWVPCSETAGLNGSVENGTFGDAGGKTRAAITLAVV
jgi:hypothetical protein